MVIIVAKIAVSDYAGFNRQATVGLAVDKKAKQYSTALGVFTDENIDRAVASLKERHPGVEVIYR